MNNSSQTKHLGTNLKQQRSWRATSKFCYWFAGASAAASVLDFFTRIQGKYFLMASLGLAIFPAAIAGLLFATTRHWVARVLAILFLMIAVAIWILDLFFGFSLFVKPM